MDVLRTSEELDSSVGKGVLAAKDVGSASSVRRQITLSKARNSERMSHFASGLSQR